MRVLWLGGVFTEEAVGAYPAVNAAANRWSLGLLRSVQALGHTVFVLGHRPERTWPKGRLFPGRHDELIRCFEGAIVPYVNVHKARKPVLRASYLRQARGVLAKFRPEVVVTYNAFPWCIACGLMARHTYGIPWVPLILDYEDVGPAWEYFRKDLEPASAFVFLSYWGYRNCPLPQPRLHLDGGNEAWYGGIRQGREDGNAAKVLLHAGKYNSAYGGADLLVDALRKIRARNLRIVLCGKRGDPCIEELVANDERVVAPGFVSDADLHDYHVGADVFLNVRPPDVGGNRMIYPSKIANYLSYGKPVVSSWTPGLAPVYRQFLIVPAQHTAEGFARAIDDTLAWPASRVERYREDVQEWFVNTHTWDAQATRLVEWLQEHVISP